MAIICEKKHKHRCKKKSTSKLVLINKIIWVETIFSHEFQVFGFVFLSLTLSMGKFQFFISLSNKNDLQIHLLRASCWSWHFFYFLFFQFTSVYSLIERNSSSTIIRNCNMSNIWNALRISLISLWHTRAFT